MILFPQADREVAEEFIRTLETLRDEVNESREPFPISFAYGYCSSDDERLTEERGSRALVEQVYRIADERMYERKVAMKEAEKYPALSS